MVTTIKLSKTGKHAGKYETIVDDCDADLAELNWSLLSVKEPYARRKVNKKHVMLHIVILERMMGRSLLSGEKVDHIDMNTMNNTRGNLRVATQSQNMQNQGLGKHSTTGVKNVWWASDKKRYKVTLLQNGKKVYVGSFRDLEAAKKARDIAIHELRGEFARVE